MRLKNTLGLLAGVLALAVTAGSSPAVVAAETAPTVALSNAFIGNGWRRSMISSFEAAATKAQADGLISSFKVANAPGENSATEQIAQLKSLLLERPDILLVNPASPTALSPTLAKACAQGIIVVVFDSGIESACSYVVTNSFPDWATVATNHIIDAMGGKGNLLISRGVVGSDPEAQYYNAQLAALENHPEIKIVGEITAFCDSAKAQEALLGVIASLPEVDGVAGCGDGFGIARAFTTAGLDIPVLAFEPSGRALKYWADNPVREGSIAIMSDPGQGVAALFAAIKIFNGEEIPQTTIFPSVLITEESRDEWVDVVGDDEIASWQWTKELVDAQIQAQIDGTSAALPPVPTK